MKLSLKILVALLLLANIAKAQTVADDLVGLGMPAEQAEYLADNVAGGAVLDNNAYLKAENQAGDANINVLKVDATDDTVLNADAGDTIKLAINGTTEITVGDDSLTFSGASAAIAFGATSGIIKLAGNTELTLTDDTLTFAGAAAKIAGGATSVTHSIGGTGQVILTDGALSPVTDNDIDLGDATHEYKNVYVDGTIQSDALLMDGNISFSTGYTIGANTSDGSDSLTANLIGGGATGSGRGGSIALQGNDVGGADTGGGITLSGGTGSSGNITQQVNATSTAIIHSYAFSNKMKFLTAQAVVNTTSGATQAATNLIPAGASYYGCTVRVNTEVTGCASMTIGDGSDADLWGAGIALTAGTATTNANFTAAPYGFAASAVSPTLTCTGGGGSFTAGAVRITCIYSTMTGPTS